MQKILIHYYQIQNLLFELLYHIYLYLQILNIFHNKINKVNVFFDLDGVLVQECGIAEIGYGFLIQLIQTNIIPEKVEQKYIDLVQQFRKKIKGLHPILKIQSIRDNCIGNQCQYNNLQILKFQSQYIINLIQQKFKENNYVNYWTCNINQLKQELTRLQQIYDIQYNTLTANCTENTNFLIDEVLKINNLISNKLCYKTQEQPENSNKTQMLTEYLKQENKFNDINIIIGDGPNDMKAANDCNCIGIAVDGVQGGQYNVKSQDLLNIIQIIENICINK